MSIREAVLKERQKLEPKLDVLIEHSRMEITLCQEEINDILSLWDKISQDEFLLGCATDALLDAKRTIARAQKLIKAAHNLSHIK